MSPSLSKALPRLLLLGLILVGCGGGGTSIQPPPPPAPMFTSTPVTAAEEGMPYSYELAATVSGSSAITFALTTAPAGATLSGSTITWTPTHAESRVSNSFTATATTAAGGSATQSWTVTPTGNVNITATITYWTPTGSTNVAPQWQANLPYPAALVPQTDGSLQRLQGAANADGSFSIPDVPAGSYWLQMNPEENYWTTTSDFDYGQDVVGRPGAGAAQSTTTFDYSISGIAPPAAEGDYLAVQTDVRNIGSLPVPSLLLPNTSTLSIDLPVTSGIDWSQITTLYVSQHQLVTSGNFSGYLLGPSQTLPNIAFTSGGTNPINATLSAGPTASLSLKIDGTAWTPLASSVGPGNPTLSFSDFSLFVQPYVNDRYALPAIISQAGPDLGLIRPATPVIGINQFTLSDSYGCAFSLGTFAPALPGIGIAPILTDVDYGTLSYSDPYPSNWLRVFQYCQASTVTLPRPNSAGVTDTFIVANNATIAPPPGPVTPILSSVQSPMLNGRSLFNSATLTTTTLNLSWAPPAIGQPIGYFVEVYQLQTLSSGTTEYIGAGNYATTQTSLTLPFISPNNTYVFAILAAADGNANIETSPLRHKLPIAESGLVSAPFVLAPGATSTAARIK
jgi:hypothetical protein